MTPVHPDLSKRQEAVLLGLADGLGVREIAAALGTTERAVIRLRERARRNLGAVTQTQAVAILVRMRAGAAKP